MNNKKLIQNKSILMLLSVILGVNFYVFFRLGYLIPAFPGSRIILLSVAVLLLIFFIFYPLTSFGFLNRFPNGITSFMHRVALSWMIMMFYLLFIFFVLDILRITGILPLNQYMFSSWKGFGILFLFISTLLMAGNVIYHHKKRVELTIKTAKEIALNKPLKIVAVSDLHLGYNIGTREFRKWVNLINREEPDVVLIAGDAIDNSLKPMYDKNFTDIFREIKTKYGIYQVLGNHEFRSNITGNIDFLTNAGVVVLSDTAVLVDNAFYIVGRDDKSNPERKTIAELTASLDKSKPIILLDHQPYHLDEVEENNIDLYIAGHTHNGQVIPATWIVKTRFELPYGYLKKGNTHFYVSSGLGIWGGKFRLGSRSEYVVINME